MPETLDVAALDAEFTVGGAEGDGYQCRICAHPLRAWIDHRLRRGTGVSRIATFAREKGYRVSDQLIGWHKKRQHHVADA